MHLKKKRLINGLNILFQQIQVSTAGNEQQQKKHLRRMTEEPITHASITATL